MALSSRLFHFACGSRLGFLKEKDKSQLQKEKLCVETSTGFGEDSELLVSLKVV